MNIRTSYRHTLYASYLGYVTQAVVNNFVPLLLLTFQSTWGISLSRLATLVSVNFGIQLLVDLAGARFVDRIGYRPCIVTAHIMAGAGLICLGILPFCLPDPFVGILLSIMLYAVGGGLTEVLISPIVEACPTDHKDAAMSLLHSFYCWGHVFVILVSTAYFALFGIENWRYMSFAWAALPLLNAVYFSLVPLRRLDEAVGTAPLTIRQLLCRPVFWLFVVLMLCAGASEQAMSQWSSAFAEQGLSTFGSLSAATRKTLSDLAGPCLFALLMGTARVVSARLSHRHDMRRMMLVCCVTCMGSYLLAALAPSPLAALAGCGLCGLSVGIMWPGTFSLSTRACPGGGTPMFALLALAGDFGCTAGPWLVGRMAGDTVRSGLLPALVFPALLFAGLLACRTRRQGVAVKR